MRDPSTDPQPGDRMVTAIGYTYQVIRVDRQHSIGPTGAVVYRVLELPHAQCVQRSAFIDSAKITRFSVWIHECQQARKVIAIPA